MASDHIDRTREQRPMTRPALFAVSLLAVAVCQTKHDDHPHQADPTVEYVSPRYPADRDAAPFSGAVWVGNTLHLSGTLGLDRGQVPETAEQEARNVLDNIATTLESAGLTMDDLVVVHVYASDVDDYDVFNGVYRTYFTTEFPARAFLGSGNLLFGARFEVVGIAARR